MKSIDEARKRRLIREGHKLLDRAEAALHHIVSSIKSKNLKKAA